MDKISIEVDFLYKEILLKINLILYEENIIDFNEYERLKQKILNDNF